MIFLPANQEPETIKGLWFIIALNLNFSVEFSHQLLNFHSFIDKVFYCF
jgi:hypothetical protein